MKRCPPLSRIHDRIVAYCRCITGRNDMVCNGDDVFEVLGEIGSPRRCGGQVRTFINC
jgi:hypothetical protein